MPKSRKITPTVMRVLVGNHTYECDIIDIKVGDKVLLPTPYWLQDVKGPTWIGEVTSLNSDYDGQCERIIRKVT